MNFAAKEHHRRVLIGPSSLNEIEEVKWPAASVRYLKKYRADSPQSKAEWIFYDLGTMREAVANRSIDKELARFLVSLNKDVNCLFLAERERSSFFDGAFLAPVEIANCARFAWLIARNEAPDLVVFHNHPHELFTYVLLKLALHLEIPTLLVHFSALPWRMCISRYSKDGSISKMKLREKWSEAEATSVKKYMVRLQSSHEKAIPATDLRLISAHRTPLHFGDELRALIKGSVAKNVVRIMRKRSLHKAFKKYVTLDPPKGPYVAFLMHYQPEEATLPRGGIFAQQLNAILRLRALLPPDVNILVKENRATFRAPLTLATGVRSPAFYKAMSSVPGTYLVPLDYDTFELLDDSIAVATITGSVGLEALCRGRKVLTFGDANYKHFSGVTSLDSEIQDLARVIAEPNHDPALTEADLLSELLFSLGPDAEDNKANFRSQQTAAIDAFSHIALGNIALKAAIDFTP